MRRWVLDGTVFKLLDRLVRWLHLILAFRRLHLRNYFNEYSKLKGLILAQNERWRHGLGMQVERNTLV